MLRYNTERINIGPGTMHAQTIRTKSVDFATSSVSSCFRVSLSNRYFLDKFLDKCSYATKNDFPKMMLRLFLLYSCHKTDDGPVEG